MTSVSRTKYTIWYPDETAEDIPESVMYDTREQAEKDLRARLEHSADFENRLLDHVNRCMPDSKEMWCERVAEVEARMLRCKVVTVKITYEIEE